MKHHYLFSYETDLRVLGHYLQYLRDEGVIKRNKNRFKPREKFPVGDLVGVIHVDLELLDESRREEINSYLKNRYGAVPEHVPA